jgi:protein O-mannosyl-transferase
MKKWVAIALLAGVTVVIYANTLANGFAMDDGLYIFENSKVTEPTLRGLFQPHPFSNVFRPLTFATLSFNFVTAHEHAFSYHLFNLLLEAMVAVLLFLLLRELLVPMADASLIAFAAALLFAVHPIHTEAVASIANRSEILAAGFVFAAWLLHLKGRPIPALLCYSLALLSKESAVVFLPIVVVVDYVRGNWKPVWRYLEIAGTTIVYLAVLWTVSGGHFGDPDTIFLDNPLKYLPLLLRVPNAIRIAWKYLGLMVYPRTFSVDYSYNAIPLYSRWPQLLPATLAAAGVILLWLWAVKTRRVAWAIAGSVYLIGFSVTANILIPTGTIMGERLAYFSSAGFCLAAALLWWMLVTRKRELAWTLLIAASAVLGVRTIIRNADWRNDNTISQSAVDAEPDSAKMRANLAVVQIKDKRYDAARENLAVSLQIYPDFADAIEDLGLLQYKTGHREDARRLFQIAYGMTPEHDVHFALKTVNLAALLLRDGESEEALRLLDRVIEVSPDYGRSYAVRAVLHYRAGDLADARADALRAINLDPENPQFRGLVRLFAQNASASSN